MNLRNICVHSSPHFNSVEHLIRVVRKHDLTNKKTTTKTKTMTNIFWEHLKRVIFVTFNHWGIWSEWWENTTWPTKRQQQRQIQWQIYFENTSKERKNTGSVTPSCSSALEPWPALKRFLRSFYPAGWFHRICQERDELVIKLVRKIQGEVLKRVRGYVFGKKRDQRELIKVGQRNFRKYMSMRDWGWFVIIQKTRYLVFHRWIFNILVCRALIGQPNPAEELAMLETKAAQTWGKGIRLKKNSANLGILSQRGGGCLTETKTTTIQNGDFVGILFPQSQPKNDIKNLDHFAPYFSANA